MPWKRLLDSWLALTEMLRGAASGERPGGLRERRRRRRAHLVRRLEELARAELRRDHALPAEEPASASTARQSDGTGWQS